ncbi:hypothetical protein GCM10010177_20960 [Actinomadura citrea]|nr:hypothetical protein GCM10010177_20960 [Actinomadura citrea]
MRRLPTEKRAVDGESVLHVRLHPAGGDPAHPRIWFPYGPVRRTLRGETPTYPERQVSSLPRGTRTHATHLNRTCGGPWPFWIPLPLSVREAHRVAQGVVGVPET